MNDIDRWFERAARREGRTVSLYASLLTGRIARYFAYRMRYALLLDGTRYVIHVAEFLIILTSLGGKASHGDKQNYYAVDIVMPEGTPILAARDGTVMTVDNDFYGAGLDLKQYGDRANNIRIAHSDGTMAVYAHLQLESAKVAVGDRVRAGQQLALSGDTGYTSGPHLHFCIQVNANMQIVSVPFNFSAGGAAFQPEPGMMLGE